MPQQVVICDVWDAGTPASTRESQQPRRAHSATAQGAWKQQPTDMAEAAEVENRGKIAQGTRYRAKTPDWKWALRPLGVLGSPCLAVSTCGKQAACHPVVQYLHGFSSCLALCEMPSSPSGSLAADELALLTLHMVLAGWCLTLALHVPARPLVPGLALCSAPGLLPGLHALSDATPFVQPRSRLAFALLVSL